VTAQAPDRGRAVRDAIEMLLEPVVEIQLPLGAQHDAVR
jgi:hypothetical protein